MLDFNAKSVEYAASLIKSGEIVAFPTETVYGLGADTHNTAAITKIYQAKGRPNSNPLIVHISRLDMLYSVAERVSERAEKIVKAFMPAPLTIVLPKKKSVPDTVTAGLPTVAIRMPQSAQAREFISACNLPIAAPSANTSSRPSPTCAQDVYDDLKGKIPLILAGERCQVGIESTVLSLVDEPIILRPGIITPTQISEVLGEKVKVLTKADGKVNSPGVFFKHYAPNCPAVLFVGDDTAQVYSHYQESLSKYSSPCILCTEKFVGSFPENSVYSMGETEEEVARNYFSLLRQTEKEHDYIIILFNPKGEIGESILNRMTKSVENHIYTEGTK